MARLLLNSNFSWKFDDRVLEILDCLEDDTIIISCDGYSQETCEKYRVGVDFDLVMHNVELINNRKKPQTQLHWQYLRFPWNLDEVEAAAEFCKSRQIGSSRGTGGITPDYPMLPTPRTPDPGKSRCDFFRSALSINFDGEVYPCCAVFRSADLQPGQRGENQHPTHLFTRKRQTNARLPDVPIERGRQPLLQTLRRKKHRPGGILEVKEELTLPQAG